MQVVVVPHQAHVFQVRRRQATLRTAYPSVAVPKARTRAAANTHQRDRRGCNRTRVFVRTVAAWRSNRFARSSHQRAHGVVVSHPLRMRKALGSIPSVSMFRDGACQVLSLLHVVEVAPAQHGLLKKCFLGVDG